MAASSTITASTQPLTPAFLQTNSGAFSDIVNSVLNLKATADQDTANAQAQLDQAQGDTAEAGAYTNASTIAQQNSYLAGVSGKIQQVQQLREAFKTIGSQKAQVAAAGFASSGSSLDLLRSSTQQAYLQNQILGVNANLQQGAFLQQAQASQAEVAAATAASSAATTLSQQEAKAGKLAQANATNEASALTKLFPGLAQGTLATEAAAGKPVDENSLAAQITQQTGAVDKQMFFNGRSEVAAGTTNPATGQLYPGDPTATGMNASIFGGKNGKILTV